MAVKITDECINCGLCEQECHNDALRLISNKNDTLHLIIQV